MYEDAKLKMILADPCTSFWLETAIRNLLARDPVDAVRDAETLCSLMQDRERAALGITEPKPKAAKTETPTEQLIRVATDTLSQLKEAQEAEEGPWPCMPWPEVDNLEQAIERYKDEVKK